jgi:tetratricopeptide (TPR) repeat protein
MRPEDPRARYNLGGALYKNGRLDEAEALYRALGSDGRSEIAAAARFNLGNALFQKQDFRGAAGAYRDALRLTPGDEATRRNLELALRALKQQQKQQERQDEGRQGKDQQDGHEQRKQPQQGQQKSPPSATAQKARRPPPQSAEERERERFRKETGMPKERAMQLLEALQRNEKEQQRKELALRRAERKGGKDW